jgi:homogentisate 1,2-dioxygenase
MYLSCSFVVFPDSHIKGFHIVPIPWYHNLSIETYLRVLDQVI